MLIPCPCSMVVAPDNAPEPEADLTGFGVVGASLRESSKAVELLELWKKSKYLDCKILSVNHSMSKTGRLSVSKTLITMLHDQFVRLTHQKHPLGLWLCVKCGWEGKYSAGHARPLEHAMGHITTFHWQEWHKTDAIPHDMNQFIKSHRRAGSRINGCDVPADKAMILKLVEQGCAYALVRAKFCGWLPLDAALGTTLQSVQNPLVGFPNPADAAGTLNLEAAQRMHVIAAVTTALSFRGLSHPNWKYFLEAVSGGRYTPPAKNKVIAIVKQLSADISAKVDEILKQRGPWAIAHDGATSSNGDQLLNVLAQSAHGETLHLNTHDATWRKKDGAMLARILRAEMLRCGQVSCVVTDGASNCECAKKILHADAELPVCEYLRCGEHCANRMVYDIIKAVPWLDEVTQQIHKACRYVVRKKKAQQLVRRSQLKAKKLKTMAQTLKIRCVRQTRFFK